MNDDLNSISITKNLVRFDTTSYKSNLDLVRYVQSLLSEYGIASKLVFDSTQKKANLFASVGPIDTPGIILSGHTDVVPVSGQEWDTDPFEVVELQDNLYGRGTADMKGFVACAVLTMIKASSLKLKTPLHLCLSYDEEIGCIGVRNILEVLKHKLITPKLCIIGEPTMMKIATGHKGKAVYQAVCRGEEGHSAYAPQFQNAIHIASDLIDSIQRVQANLAQQGKLDPEYEIPYSTLHIGKINGGTALNIVPNECIVDFEIRHLANEYPEKLVEGIYTHLEQNNSASLKWIDLHALNNYPGLDTPKTLEAVRFLHSCLSDKDVAVNKETTKIGFGTEGGLFTQFLECPVLVCGPGSISVAHKPNEYIPVKQLNECETFLERLISKLL